MEGTLREKKIHDEGSEHNSSRISRLVDRLSPISEGDSGVALSSISEEIPVLTPEPTIDENGEADMEDADKEEGQPFHRGVYNIREVGEEK